MLNVSYICVVFLILWNTVFDTLDNAFRVLKSKFKRLTNLSIVLVNDFHTPHPPPPVQCLKSLIVSVSRQLLLQLWYLTVTHHHRHISHSFHTLWHVLYQQPIKGYVSGVASATCGLQSRGWRRETDKLRVPFKLHLDFPGLDPFCWMCVAYSYPADPPSPEGRHWQKLGGVYVKVSIL